MGGMVPTRRVGCLDPATARVCIVLPLEPEADSRLRDTLDSIVQQTFPRDRIEILACVYASSRSRAELESYNGCFSAVRVLDCSGQVPGTALNLALAATQADIIMQLDARTCLGREYIQRCVVLMTVTVAAAVGGLRRPAHGGGRAEAVGLAVASRDALSEGRARRSRRIEYVDSIYPCAYRREVLLEVGGHDPQLPYAQNDDLHYRIRRAGFRILRYPALVSTYAPPESFSALWRESYARGSGWALVKWKRAPTSNLWRVIPPSLLVLVLAPPACLAVLGLPGLFVLVGAYLYLAVVAGLVRSRQKPHLAPLVALVFPLLHVSQEMGYIVGLARLVLPRKLREHGGRGPLPEGLAQPPPSQGSSRYLPPAASTVPGHKSSPPARVDRRSGTDRRQNPGPWEGTEQRSGLERRFAAVQRTGPNPEAVDQPEQNSNC